ncbi:protein SYS1 homolog [Aplysia californica]|uniref:Protein SYS1 homolog n=1 Tax=Aplysia californica TaxID=6500 RepID=A0ABM0K031_APLCA|nr:protein SYS1 homolog [Aplysia californica]
MLHLMRLPWSNMAGQFRSFQWDPVLIIAQIISMISLWYFSLGMWVFVLDVIGKFDLSTEQIFTQSDLGLFEDSGRTNIIAYALNSLTVSFLLWGVVGRTKQCLDFTATVHVFHFLACWYSYGFVPITFWWWVTNVGCVALTTVMAEFLCMRSEMKAIPVGMGPKVDL